MKVITPTIGRQVWFWNAAPSNREEQPCAATVVYVWNDRMVNLQVIDHGGEARSRTSVPLRQPEDPTPGGMFCEWMPFQVGQAKAQEAEKAPG